MIQASKIINTISSLDESYSFKEIKKYKHSLESLIDDIDSIETPHDYQEFYLDWREWNSSFGKLFFINLLGRDLAGNPLTVSNSALDNDWYLWTTDFLDDIEALINPHLIEKKSDAPEPSLKLLQTWLADKHKIKDKLEDIVDSYFSKLKNKLKSMKKISDHYETTTQKIKDVHITITTAEHDKNQEKISDKILDAVRNCTSLLKKFGLDAILQDSRIFVNFQFSNNPVLCRYDEVKDAIYINKMKSNYFWERSLLHVLGERSWHLFLRKNTQKEWIDFVNETDYVSVFQFSSGSDPVIESWADTLTRYVLDTELPDHVEEKFKEIIGIK
jgi:hypothetical protein